MATLILGFVLGLLAGPVIRSWIVWREYKEASRQAWLAEETLRRMEEETDHSREPGIDPERPRRAL